MGGGDILLDSLRRKLDEAVNRQNEIQEQLNIERQQRLLAEQERKNAGLQAELDATRSRNEAENAARDRERKLDEQRRAIKEREEAREAEFLQEKAALEAKHREHIRAMEHQISMQKMRTEADARRNPGLDSRPITAGAVLGPGDQPAFAHIDRWRTEVNRAQGQHSTQGFRASLNEVQEALNRGAGYTDQTSGVNILSNIGIKEPALNNIITQQAGPLPSHINNNTSSNAQGLISDPNRGMGVLELAGMAGPIHPHFALPNPDATLAIPAKLTAAGGGLGKMVAKNMQEDARSDIAEGESNISSSSMEKSKKVKNVKSGMLAKATHNIKKPTIWPHFNLQLAYAAAPVTFAQITFEQLVAGEIKTISDCHDEVEAKGRLSLLSKLALLKTRNYPWGKLQDLYAAIVREIEKDEAKWNSDWRHIEEAVIDPMDRLRSTQSQRPTSTSEDRSKKPKKKEEWYCKDYNSAGGCSKESPPEAVVGRPARTRMVKHMCAACWNKDKEVRKHSEIDRQCPNKAD